MTVADAAATAAQPALRGDLRLLEGPRRRDGAPSWLLHDPARDRYFKIGWPQFEILARWARGDAAAVAQAVRDDTPIPAQAPHARHHADLRRANGLVRPPGDAGAPA